MMDSLKRPWRSPANLLFFGTCVIVAWLTLDSIFRSGEANSLDRAQSMGPFPGMVYEPRWRTQAEERDEKGICDTRDGHYEDDVDLNAAQHPWSQMKWIGQPAACRVRGELIERLDASNNFRRGYALRFSGNVEDRVHILPWLLGTKVDLNRRKRRVFLDLGSNSFRSSLQWFIQMYPCDFTEVHAFEVLQSLLDIPKPFDEKGNIEEKNTASRMTKNRPGIPAWMLKRINVYNKLVSHRDSSVNNEVNITRFIKHDLELSADDTVIVKMDIEESEWPILTSWMNDPEMVNIVDEIFVEVHYNHSSMFDFHWNKFNHDRNQAKRLVADLRWKGFYIHLWP